MEQRIIELEKKAAFQEHLLEQLNEAIVAHQRRIKDLEGEIRRLKDVRVGDGLVIPRDEETLPPHY